MKDTAWTDVVQQQSDFAYLINPTAFATRITSLGLLIDMLDLTTALKKGKALGLRIGKMEKTSIGIALGFRPGDVITKIQHLAPTSTKNRMKIFNALAKLDMGSEIFVNFTRRGQPLTVTYTLFNLAEPSAMREITRVPQGPAVLGAPAAPLFSQVTPTAPVPAPKAPAPVVPPTPAAPVPAAPAPAQAGLPRAPIQAMQKKDTEAMKQFGSKASLQAAAQPKASP